MKKGRKRREMEAEAPECSVSEKRRKKLASNDLEPPDFDVAFEMQMQEAMAASVAIQPSTSPTLSEPPMLDDDAFHFADSVSLELERYYQRVKDREESEAEMRRNSEDLKRRLHDHKFAREIFEIPDGSWRVYGDNVEKPFSEGSSSHVVDETFRLYFKGLLSDERVKGSRKVLSGIGAAICDPFDNLIFAVQKPLAGDGMTAWVAEVNALIEGFNAALELDIKRIDFYFDYHPLYQFVIGKGTVNQHELETSLNQVVQLQSRFMSCHPYLVARSNIKFAYKLARDEINSQLTRLGESIQDKNLLEICSICLENTEVSQMFAVDGCLHRYCFSCMGKYIEVKLFNGMLPECPHEGCKSKLNIDSCRKFLSPNLVEIMDALIKESSIPVTEKVYCPIARCSALMSKTEVGQYSNNLFTSHDTGVRKCIRCQRLFCINCKCPWHSNMTCYDYKRLNPPSEDRKLKSLATQRLWRQCKKCNHMIELDSGCYHITCRCGYEFCYTCGAEWKNKKATCLCPIWTEANIIRGRR